MKENDTIDTKLWNQIAQNDEKAFNAVFDKYFSRLCNFCHPIVKEVEVAEEVVSDVFIKLGLNRHSIQIKTGLKPYLFKATRNTALNYLRQSNPNINIDEIGEKELISNINADSELIHNEVYTELQQMLNSLSPQQSLIFRMYKLDGLSQAEIAETLSISLKTVQNHIYLALKYLTAKWTSQQYEFYLFIILMLTTVI